MRTNHTTINTSQVIAGRKEKKTPFFTKGETYMIYVDRGIGQFWKQVTIDDSHWKTDRQAASLI